MTMIDFSQTNNASRVRPALVLALAALAAACSHAQGHGGHGNPPPPPPEAYTACQGKAEGDSVTLTMPDGKTLPGTCRSLDGQLVAMPAGGPGAGGPRHNPPLLGGARGAHAAGLSATPRACAQVLMKKPSP
jgi:hypothetical protein